MRFLMIMMLFAALPLQEQTQWTFDTKVDPLTDRTSESILASNVEQREIVLGITCSYQGSQVLIFHGNYLIGKKGPWGDREAEIYFRFGEERELIRVSGRLRLTPLFRRLGAIEVTGRDAKKFVKQLGETTTTRLRIQTRDPADGERNFHEITLDGAAETIAQLTRCDW